jgi:hypothetical protein
VPPPTRTREQIEADVRADFEQLDRAQRFSGAQTEFAHWNWQFQKQPWTRETILAARSDPFFLEYFGADLILENFGRGKTRPPWVVMARVFASLLHQHAQPPMQGFGSAAGPFINIIRAQLVRLLGEEGVPLRDDMLRSLKRIARETKRRLR